MDEYIKRENIRERFKVRLAASNKGTMGESYFLACLDVVDTEPAADVKPVVRGQWIATVGKKSRICSACGHDEPYKFADNDVDIFNYCPNCGADMREAPNET